MIRFILVWAAIQLKNAFRNVSFYLMIILTLLGFVLTNEIIKQYNDDIIILIKTSDTETGKFCVEYLSDNLSEGYIIRVCENEEQMKESITKSEASCAVVFDEKADELIPQVFNISKESVNINTDLSEDYSFAKDVPVRIYQPSGLTEGYFVQEILFPVIQRSTSKMWLSGYVSDDAKDYTMESYSHILENMELNIYEVVTLSKTSVINVDNEEIGINRNIHNLKLVIITVIALSNLVFGAFDLYGSDTGFYGCFKKRQQIILKTVKVLSCSLPCIMISFAGYLLYLNLIN